VSHYEFMLPELSDGHEWRVIGGGYVFTVQLIRKPTKWWWPFEEVVSSDSGVVKKDQAVQSAVSSTANKILAEVNRRERIMHEWEAHRRDRKTG
jgi:hypothetical protein